MRWLLALTLVACSSAAPRPPPVAPAPATPVEEPEPTKEEASPPIASSDVVDAPERSRPPSTATYEQAIATPERLDVNDGRPHLDDDQLRAPMRGVITACAMPRNAKVTIKTAVQNGRAIGVTVEVRFDHPPPPGPAKRPSRAAAQRAAALAKQEAKAKKKIGGCIDHAVRMLVWPPSGRRDSFTTEF
jgi:hypothetical protein